MKSMLKSFCLALCAVLALGMVAASAAGATNWTVKGAPMPSGTSETLSETTTLTNFGSETSAVLKVVAPSFWTVECSKAAVNGGKITAPNLGSFNYLAFSGCKGSAPEGRTCTVASPSQPSGTIHTQPLTSSLEKSAKGGTYDYVSSAGKALFFLEFGSSCGTAAKWEIIGTIGLKPEYGTNAALLGFETSQAIQEASGASWYVYTLKMWMQAKFDLSLASGKTWGVTP